jgi:outer membrane receptor protein involved in Fe transport
LVAGLVAALAWSVEAQELRGRLTGTVTDNTGSVLPGVTVSVSGPALIQPQTTTTGADGTYRFPALPSGVYAVTYQMSGFRGVKREGIRVTLNTTLTVDTQLELASMAEEVTITADAPVVDTKTTSIGTSFTKELLSDIPNARDLWAAMSQAPGFQMNGYDVGGSHTGTQTGYTTYGFPGDNKTLFEGINVTETRDANAGYFDYGSFEEFQLGGAGNLGEAAGPGALLNFSVKSGGDKLHGDAYFDFQNDDTISDNIPEEFTRGGGTDAEGFRAPANGLTTANTTTKQYDLNVGIGGPILKGKLWFYASYRDNNQYRIIAGLPGEKAQSQLLNKTLKLTYAINARNNIIAFYNERSKLQPLRELSLARPVDTAWYQDSKNRPVKLEWTSIVNDRVYLNLQVAHWKNDFPLFPTKTKSASNEDIGPARLDLATNQWSGAHSYYHQRVTNRPQVSGAVTYARDGWWGNHNFKLGGEWFRERREFLRFGGEGEVFYRDRAGVPVEVEVWNTPNAGVDDNVSTNVYLNDTWTVSSRLTLNLGLRYDRYRLGWPEQSFTPKNSRFFQPASTPATTVVTWNSLSPRLGFVWDVSGRGKTVVKAFAGRFFINPSTTISSLENPVGAAGIRYVFNDLNGNRLLDGPQELGRQLLTRGGAGFVKIDRGIEHPHGEELSTHLEHELVPSLSVRGSYVFKRMRNYDSEVDLARVNAHNVPLSFLDVGADNVRGTGDDQNLVLFDRPTGIGSERTWTNPCRVPGLPCEDGDYHTVEAALNRRFKDRWLLLTSFEHTWSNDFRVPTQATTSALEALRHGQNFLWNPNQRRFGRQDQTFWNFKIVGRYEFGWGVAAGVSYKLQSGYNWARVISVPFPVSGNVNVPAEPLDSNRTANVSILDFRAEKSFKLGTAGKVALLFDVFNATNSDVVTNARNTSGPRFKEVISVLDPRVFRFGVRYTY